MGESVPDRLRKLVDEVEQPVARDGDAKELEGLGIRVQLQIERLSLASGQAHHLDVGDRPSLADFFIAPPRLVQAFASW